MKRRMCFNSAGRTYCRVIAVPSDYLSPSLDWSNWNVWDAVGYQAVVPSSGFATGVVSPRNVAWNNYAQVPLCNHRQHYAKHGFKLLFRLSPQQRLSCQCRLEQLRAGHSHCYFFNSTPIPKGRLICNYVPIERRLTDCSWRTSRLVAPDLIHRFISWPGCNWLCSHVAAGVLPAFNGTMSEHFLCGTPGFLWYSLTNPATCAFRSPRTSQRLAAPRST